MDVNKDDAAAHPDVEVPEAVGGGAVAKPNPNQATYSRISIVRS